MFDGELLAVDFTDFHLTDVFAFDVSVELMDYLSIQITVGAQLAQHYRIDFALRQLIMADIGGTELKSTLFFTTKRP